MRPAGVLLLSDGQFERPTACAKLVPVKAGIARTPYQVPCGMNRATVMRRDWQNQAQESPMRLAIIGVVTAVAGLAADVQVASAQNESFFQSRYCARKGGVPSQLNCAYNTMEECKAVFEPMRYCLENPFWHGPREQPTTQAKSRRRNRQTP